jgi:mono/diheme cytochrome c family protein
MRRVWKVLGGIALVLIIGIAVLIGWLAAKKPAMRAPSVEKIEATPERLARGKYLVENVTHCLGCHSDAYFDRFALPLKPGTAGQGGFPFDKKLDVPGLVQAQNITPDPKHGIGDWSDGEVLRAIREGVNRDGEAMFPMMPYPNYRMLSDEDAKAIVAYLRTIAPIEHAVAPRQLDFPVNFVVKFIPQPLDGPVPEPDRNDTKAYGKYLATVAGCVFCHTPRDGKGRPIAGQELSGGWVLQGPWGRVVSANITPDPDTYIGKASREEFIDRFKALEHLAGENAPVAPPGKNTVMAWPGFGGMTREDLGAIYDYLKTEKPIKKTVVAFPDAPAGSGS